jgi:putative SOS response-associated peptidase YedK
MPVVSVPEEYDVWLDVDARNAEARKELLRPFPSSEMIAYPVGPQVNSPRSQGPNLVRRRGADSA